MAAKKPLELAILKTKPLSDFGVDEKWLEDRIVEDPKILGIPGVRFHSRQRRQQRAGNSGAPRLDILLQAENGEKRYEVEIQLGKTDPEHIIRTIEYWDLERQRYPRYDHCAVIVAEDITSRFFNVIGLFNRHLPIIAINVTAAEVSAGKVGLVFAHVLREQMPEDDTVTVKVDRNYWLKEYGKNETELAEYVVRDKFKAEPNYTKFYMGIVGQRNSMVIETRKKRIVLRYRQSSQSERWDAKLQKGDVDFEFRRGSYWLTMHKKSDVDKHWDIIQEMYRGETDEYSRQGESSLENSNATDSGKDS